MQCRSTEQQMIRIKRLFSLTIPFLSIFVFFQCGSDDKNGQNELYLGDKPVVPLKEYTRDIPREWSDISDEHIPRVQKTRHRGKSALLITVPLKNASNEHYIEKIGILNEENREIISLTIPRQNNPPIYAYFRTSELPLNTDLKAFAKCNLHDLWTEPIPAGYF